MHREELALGYTACSSC